MSNNINPNTYNNVTQSQKIRYQALFCLELLNSRHSEWGSWELSMSNALNEILNNSQLNEDNKKETEELK